MAIGNPAHAVEAGVSDWAHNPHSSARLLALGPSATGERQAAVEIRLDPGYLTYWRQPGEAGLPPSFDTTGSQNVAAVSVDYPAPHVFEEAGIPLFGYRGSVVFPVTVVLGDPGRPAILAMHLDYAVCAAICLPGTADLRLTLPDRVAPAAAALIEGARAAVPRPATLGAAGSLGIETVAADANAGKPGLLVTARAAMPATLFVEGPEGWFFVAGTPTERGPGTLAFPVAITDRPRGAGAVDLRLTLVDPSGAIDVPAHLPASMDAGAPKP